MNPIGKRLGDLPQLALQEFENRIAFCPYFTLFYALFYALFYTALHHAFIKGDSCMRASNVGS